MRVLVTGGHGFIGSHVLRELVADGHAVGCFDIAPPSPVAETVSDEVETFYGDITDPIDLYDSVAAFNPDRIVHLASKLGRESQTAVRSAVSINLLGTVHVLEAADTFDVDRVVAASSASTYGNVPPEVERLTEETIQRPASVYGVTKYAVERIGPTYAEQCGFEFAAIQPTHGLGPDRQRGNVEDAAIIKAAVSGTPITVPRVEYPIEIIYVVDEACAFAAAATSESLPHEKYVIGSGEQASLIEVTKTVQNLIPDAKLEIMDVNDDNQQLFRRPPSDCSRIREDLGWEPVYSIADAIRAYVEWLRENPEKWSFSVEDVPWMTEE